jgi:hypothetical protein
MRSLDLVVTVHYDRERKKYSGEDANITASSRSRGHRLSSGHRLLTVSRYFQVVIMYFFSVCLTTLTEMPKVHDADGIFCG